MDIDGVRNFVDFEVIEIVDDSFPYPVLLGIDWAFNNSTVVDIKRRHKAENKGCIAQSKVEVKQEDHI